MGNHIDAQLNDAEVTYQMRSDYFNKTGTFASDSEILKHFKLPIKSSTTKPEHYTYYGAKCSCGARLDPYTICDAYATTSAKGSAWHHAVKKLLRAGDGHKPLQQDVEEVIATLSRWLEQLK